MTREQLISGFAAGHILVQGREVSEHARSVVDELIAEGRAELVHYWQYDPAIGGECRRIKGRLRS